MHGRVGRQDRAPRPEIAWVRHTGFDITTSTHTTTARAFCKWITRGIPIMSPFPIDVSDLVPHAAHAPPQEQIARVPIPMAPVLVHQAPVPIPPPPHAHPQGLPVLLAATQANMDHFMGNTRFVMCAAPGQQISAITAAANLVMHTPSHNSRQSHCEFAAGNITPALGTTARINANTHTPAMNGIDSLSLFSLATIDNNDIINM